jgi:5-methylthioadenosine/S-adenosylhomocysteine deaminase
VTIGLRRAGAGTRPPAVVDATVWNGSAWLQHQDVVLDGDRITEVRAHRPGTLGLRIAGATVVPGWVNTHTHLLQSTHRGIADGLPLYDWLGELGDAMAELTPKRAHLAAVAGALENLRSGTTTIVEHLWPHRDPEVQRAALDGIRDVGIRAIVGCGVADRVDPTRRWGADPRFWRTIEESFDDHRRLAEAARGSRVEIGLAVANPRSISESGMRAVREFADASGSLVSMHLLESSLDEVAYREHTSVGVVEFLEHADFLWPSLLVAHGVQLDGDGIRRLAEHGVRVSWNPVANLRLGSGFAPVAEMLDAGIAVGVGTDGAASNDRQDMFEVMRTGAYALRGMSLRPDSMGFARMVRMSTADVRDGGLRGVIPGAPADLSILSFARDFATLPVGDPGDAILTTGSPAIVDSVIVGGELVIEGGRSTRIDEGALVEALLR